MKRHLSGQFVSGDLVVTDMTLQSDRLRYLNFDAIFEFRSHFTIRCITTKKKQRNKLTNKRY